MKKFLGILIAICLIVGLLPVFASAAGVATVSIVSDAAAGTMTDYTLTEGQTVEAKITAVDEEKKKISLSIRALLAPAAAEEEEAE